MNGIDRHTGFYRPALRGGVVCALCDAPDYTHAADCAVLTLHTQMRELTAQVGLFVTVMRETVETLERLLRGDAWDGPPP